MQANNGMEEELQTARERVEAEEAAQKNYAEKVEGLSRELEILKVELAATRQNVEKAEFDKTKVRHCYVDLPVEVKRSERIRP